MDQEFLRYLNRTGSCFMYGVAKEINNIGLINLFASAYDDTKKLCESFKVIFKDSKDLENLYIDEEETNEIMNKVYKKYIHDLSYTCYRIKQSYEDEYQQHLKN